MEHYNADERLRKDFDSLDSGGFDADKIWQNLQQKRAKKVRKIILWQRFWYAAAVFLIGFGISFWFNTKTENQPLLTEKINTKKQLINRPERSNIAINYNQKESKTNRTTKHFNQINNPKVLPLAFIKAIDTITSSQVAMNKKIEVLEIKVPVFQTDTVKNIAQNINQKPQNKTRKSTRFPVVNQYELENNYQPASFPKNPIFRLSSRENDPPPTRSITERLFIREN